MYKTVVLFKNVLQAISILLKSSLCIIEGNIIDALSQLHISSDHFLHKIIQH